jgi:uncharacterized protein (TIGR02284 family)
MHPSDEKPVKALNTLIGVNNNRYECCKYAFGRTGAGILKVLFSRMAETSEDCLAALSAEVYKLGGRPHTGTIADGTFLRAWTEIRSAFERNDHLSILNAFAFQEGVIIRGYEKLLSQADETFNSIQRRVCEAQYGSLLEDSEKLNNLRDVMVKAMVRDAVMAESRVRVEEPALGFPLVPSYSFR